MEAGGRGGRRPRASADPELGLPRQRERLVGTGGLRLGSFWIEEISEASVGLFL